MTRVSCLAAGLYLISLLTALSGTSGAATTLPSDAALPPPPDLHGQDLHGRSFRGAFLFRASLRDANLRQADLRAAMLVEADLTGAALEGADLSRAELSLAVLRTTNLRRANLRRADLNGATLDGADVEGANLTGADLAHADLRRAVHLGKSRLREARLAEAILDGADLSGADLSGIQLPGANLTGTILDGADLSSAGLRSVRLHSATLTKANLDGADLSGALLDGADLRDASLVGAILTGTDLNAAHLEGVDLSQVKGLSRRQLARALVDRTTRLPPLDAAAPPNASSAGAASSRRSYSVLRASTTPPAWLTDISLPPPRPGYLPAWPAVVLGVMAVLVSRRAAMLARQRPRPALVVMGIAGAARRGTARLPLDYAPARPASRLRTFGWVAAIVAFVAVSAAGVRWGPWSWNQAMLLWSQHVCLSYSAPPDQVAHEEDATAAATLLSRREYRPIASGRPQPAACLVPACYARLAQHLRTPAALGGGVVFLHELYRPDGQRRLVAVLCVPGPTGSGFPLQSLVIRPADWHTTPAVSLSPIDVQFHSASIGSGRAPLRAFAGQPDPLHRSRFRLLVEQGPNTIVVTGRLTDDDCIEYYWAGEAEFWHR